MQFQQLLNTNWPMVAIYGKSEADPEPELVEVACFGLDLEGNAHAIVFDPKKRELVPAAEYSSTLSLLSVESEGEEPEDTKPAAAPTKIPNFLEPKATP